MDRSGKHFLGIFNFPIFTANCHCLVVQFIYQKVFHLLCQKLIFRFFPANALDRVLIFANNQNEVSTIYLISIDFDEWTCSVLDCVHAPINDVKFDLFILNQANMESFAIMCYHFEDDNHGDGLTNFITTGRLKNDCILLNKRIISVDDYLTGFRMLDDKLCGLYCFVDDLDGSIEFSYWTINLNDESNQINSVYTFDFDVGDMRIYNGHNWRALTGVSKNFLTL